jgi:hypothetical protein
MKFKFISICTYLCGACSIYCSVSNYFGPNEFGDHIVLEYVLSTWEIYIGACLNNKDEAVTS